MTNPFSDIDLYWLPSYLKSFVELRSLCWTKQALTKAVAADTERAAVIRTKLRDFLSVVDLMDSAFIKLIMHPS